MANPLVAQGTLNRLRASLIIPANSALNITAAFLGDEGISLALEGNSTDYLPTLTGQVTSPAIQRMATVTAHLLKSQTLADAYKVQEQQNTLLGEVRVRPDARTLGDYTFFNASISGITELSMNGTNAGYMVRIQGVYYINSSLFDAD